MSDLETLSPRLYGAEVLVRMAKTRATGVLRWRGGRKNAQLLFVSGRPQRFLTDDGSEVEEREAVVSGLRAVAIANTGICEFQVMELSDVADRESLRIDTLGEVMFAIIRELEGVHLDSFWDARMRQVVEPAPLFERLSKAVQRIGGQELDRPAQKLPAGSLISGASQDAQRAWAALLMMGALHVVEDLSRTAPREQLDAIVDEALETTDDTVEEHAIDDVTVETPIQEYVESLDEEARELALEIDELYEKIEELDHYEVLGIRPVAAVEEIGRAYLVQARRWHSDRLAGLSLGPLERKAEEIFMRVEEAYRILNDPKERENYDFLQSRRARGLPTDPAIIMEAEDLFKRAETLVRMGKPVGVEPLLRRAIELNQGEPEFWAYFGWAQFNASQDRAGRQEAFDAIARAKRESPDLAVIYEFIGRMARVEGDTSAAARNLKKALQLSPDNPDAERELRLLQMRKGSDDTGEQAGLMGALKGLFKKK